MLQQGTLQPDYFSLCPVYMLGGHPHFSVSTSNRLQAWNGNKCVELAKMPETRTYFAAALSNNFLFVTGGEDNYHYLQQDTQIYNLALNLWEEGPKLCEPRRSHCLQSLTKDTLLVSGGLNRNGWLESTELFVPGCKRWVKRAEMNNKRGNHTSTTIEEVPFVFGGYDGNDWLNTAEYSKKEEDKWSLLPMMKHKRAEAGVTKTWKQHVVLTGGWNRGALSTVELFDPYKMVWCELPELKNRRCSHCCITLGNMVIVYGGKDENRNVLRPEFYDERQKKWFYVDISSFPNLVGSVCVQAETPQPTEIENRPMYM